MLRTLSCALATVILAATFALAGEITDVDNTFRFTVPEGWTKEAPPIPTLALVVVSPRRPETGGNCNVVAAPDETTKSMSQSELESLVSGQINEKFWKDAIGGVEGAKSTTIDKWGDKTQRGRKVFYVKATSDYVIAGHALTVTQVMDLHAIPGRTYAVTCTALADGFAREASDFESIMASFEPTPELTVAAVRGRAPSSIASAGRGPVIAHAAAKVASEALEAGFERARAR